MIAVLPNKPHFSFSVSLKKQANMCAVKSQNRKKKQAAPFGGVWRLGRHAVARRFFRRQQQQQCSAASGPLGAYDGREVSQRRGGVRRSH
jgi:hypothetical protein